MKRKNNTTKKRNEYKNASRYIVYLLKCVLNQLEFKNLPVDCTWDKIWELVEWNHIEALIGNYIRRYKGVIPEEIRKTGENSYNETLYRQLCFDVEREKIVKELEKLCKKHDVLLMIDEVQTGMGRTGTLFCYEQYGIEPDVITSSKALGGGLPIGACLCTERLGEVLNSGMHGSTFGGNPVACAGALSVLERVSDETFLQEVKAKGEYMQQKLSEMEGVAEVRGIGMMIGIVLEKGTAKDVAAACIKHGLLVLTAKTLVRLLPPLTITFEEIDKGLAILEKVIKQA